MTERSLEALVRTIRPPCLRAYRREKTRIPAEFRVITEYHLKARLGTALVRVIVVADTALHDIASSVN
jgi:hypothetical protein